ncbi:hypothetical protein D3C80_435350 [compost metagenome]
MAFNSMPEVRRALYLKYPLRYLKTLWVRFKHEHDLCTNPKRRIWYRQRIEEIESVLSERTEV